MSETHRRNHKKQAVKKAAGNQDVTLSKALSYVLRHAAPSLGLEPSPDGYVPVDDILSLSHPKFRDKQSGLQRYTVDDIIRVVEMNEKRRFKLEYKSAPDDGYVEGTLQSISAERNKKLLCIRANQGHSFKAGLQSNKLLMPLDAGELSSSELIIVHGTTQRAWEQIRIEGLRRMKRNHIHFATGLPNGQKTPLSGMRSSSEIYIYISGKKCAEDAIPFYRSDNGVILTAGVDEGGLLPIKYFDKVVQASSSNVIWEHGQD
mmetsp:Transcript_8954/g.13309  ORF Transcript_8954/g.13309 Transcript_8954/m.13309 type:complete len:261 (-) Transcript_8954:274-1056(-)